MSHVLYVDDNEDLLGAVATFFQGEAFTLHTLSSPQSALALMDRQPIDAVISDLDMPGMNGLEFLATVRTRFPTVYRVLVSGSETRRLMLNIPANDPPFHLFASKPFSRQGWKRILDKVVPRG